MHLNRRGDNLVAPRMWSPGSGDKINGNALQVVFWDGNNGTMKAAQKLKFGTCTGLAPYLEGEWLRE